MQDTSIRKLLTVLRDTYAGKVTPYASAFERAEEEHGLSWRLDGASVTFSAITLGGTLPTETYDVQIESHPPGECLFTGQLSLAELLELIRRYFGPDAEWPITS